MEPWQSKCIQENLGDLIDFTDCNVQFLAELNSHLSKFDKAELGSTKLNDLEKTGYFYKIAQKRKGIFEDLLMALIKTKQSGAFSILMQEYITQSNGGVSNCFTATQVQLSHSWWNKDEYRSEKIETFKFSSSLFSFLDLLLSKHNTLITDSSIQNTTKEFLSKWVHACVMGSYINLLKLAIRQGVILRIFDSKILLLLAVSYSDTSIVDLILTHYPKQTNVTLPNTKFEFECWYGYSFKYSILDIAALRGSLPVIQTLLRATADDAVNMAHLMCLSVVDTRLLQDPDVQIIERKRIIEFILQKLPKLIQNWPTDVDTPLLYPNVHVDLITQLISLGFDVHATNDDSSNILDHCPIYMSPEEYNKLIGQLHAREKCKIFHTKDDWKDTPLHMAMQYLELLDSTLELFLSAKVDFNSVNRHFATPLHSAVEYHRSERLLKSLVCAGADINKQDCVNQSVLHIAAKVGNLTALKYLISCGCEVNAITNSGYTSLDYALICSEKQTHEIVQELVQNEARVNTLKKEHLLSRIKDGKVESRTVALVKAAGIKLPYGI